MSRSQACAGKVIVAIAVAVALVGCGGDDPAGSAITEPTASVPVPGHGLEELPDREPDVTGVVGTGDEYAEPPHLLEPSDGYYLGMSLLQGDPVVVAADGTVVAASDLQAGDEVAVWTGEACAESFPVQCDIVGIQVTQPST
jgi:hypothetical protein